MTSRDEGGGFTDDYAPGHPSPMIRLLSAISCWRLTSPSIRREPLVMRSESRPGTPQHCICSIASTQHPTTWEPPMRFRPPARLLGLTCIVWSRTSAAEVWRRMSKSSCESKQWPCRPFSRKLPDTSISNAGRSRALQPRWARQAEASGVRCQWQTLRPARASHLPRSREPARGQEHVKWAFGGPACGTVSAQHPEGAKAA